MGAFTQIMAKASVGCRNTRLGSAPVFFSASMAGALIHLPDLVGEHQGECERDSDARQGQNEPLAQFFQMLQEGHAHHPLLVVILPLIGGLRQGGEMRLRRSRALPAAQAIPRGSAWPPPQERSLPVVVPQIPFVIDATQPATAWGSERRAALGRTNRLGESARIAGIGDHGLGGLSSFLAGRFGRDYAVFRRRICCWLSALSCGCAYSGRTLRGGIIRGRVVRAVFVTVGRIVVVAARSERCS